MPLAGVPRTCRVSESHSDTQRHGNTRIKWYCLSFSYHAETVSFRKAEFAGADVSEEYEDMHSTHMGVGGTVGERNEAVSKDDLWAVIVIQASPKSSTFVRNRELWQRDA